MTPAQTGYTLVYDGDCRMCSRVVSGLRRWDRAGSIEIVPSQQADVTARFPWIAPTAFAESLQLVGPNDRTWQGAAAVEKLLDVLPRGAWIRWVFRIPYVRGVADRMYRWVARNRYRLGCGDHCSARGSGKRDEGKV